MNCSKESFDFLQWFYNLSNGPFVNSLKNRSSTTSFVNFSKDSFSNSFGALIPQWFHFKSLQRFLLRFHHIFFSDFFWNCIWNSSRSCFRMFSGRTEELSEIILGGISYGYGFFWEFNCSFLLVWQGLLQEFILEFVCEVLQRFF